MALVLHRSPRTEDLLQVLAAQLQAHWPADPFEAVPIVVGSRGMERWLKHRLAEQLGIAAGLAFPFPRQALEGAISWLLDPQRPPRAPFWQTQAAVADPWQADALTLKVVPLLRAQAGAEAYQAVTRYLGYGQAADPHAPVMAREYQFARQVADTLDRLLHERPLETATWPASAPPEHAWLADLLQHLRRDLQAEDPAARLELLSELNRRGGLDTGRQLHVFGLSTLGLGELLRLEHIAKHLTVHLYLLAPSQEWWQDVRGPRQAAQALRHARQDEELDQTLQDLANQNPLLASLGQPSQFLQARLEEFGYTDPDTPAPQPADAQPGTLLQQLQQWVVQAGAPRSPEQAPWPSDESLQFHSTHGPLRQVEVLRDQLLRLMVRHPQLMPRDILVMTPDVATFAPLVSAVFARAEPPSAGAGPGQPARTPPLPVEIADMGITAANPVAEALVAAVALAGERATAPRLVDLLQLAPVRQRFGLESEDLGVLREMIEDSAMRWGFDGADRLRHGQPELDQNTVRFGLERLALGALLPESTELVPGLPMPLVPSPVGGQDRLALLGKLMAWLRAVEHHCEQLRQPRSPRQWSADLRQTLDDLTETTAKTGWLHTEVVQALEQLATEDSDLPLDRTALQCWLAGRFDLPQHGDRPITGAIQVCALEPMRSVPFQVVALLGMDDGVFPRSSTPPSWDPFAVPRPGERDRRATDRHLLLEALMCARGAVLVLWSGRSVTTGKPLPAAVPIEELLAAVAQQTASHRDQLVTEHPLQPWSTKAFQPGPCQSFAADMAQAAHQLQEVARGAAQPLPLAWSKQLVQPLPEEEELPRHLTSQQIASGLAGVQQLLLRERLGLLGVQDSAPLPDREPLELEFLDRWSLLNGLLEEVAQETASIEELEAETDQRLHTAMQQAAGRGELPLQAGGKQLLRAQWQKALQALAQLRQVQEQAVGTGPSGPWTVDAGLAAVHASAPTTVATAHGLVLQWLVASMDPSPRSVLQAWVALLAAAAAGHGEIAILAAQIATTGEKSVWLMAPPAAEALHELRQLLELWYRARRQALPLFSAVGKKLASYIAAGKRQLADLEPKERAALAEAWHGGSFSRGDLQTAEVAQLFRGMELEELLAETGENSLFALAEQVWLPIVCATASSKTNDVNTLASQSESGAEAL